MIEVGQEAPDFTLPSASGGTVRLGDLRGKKRALLVFYPKDQTSGCTAQLCAIRDNYDALRGHDVAPFGINGDDADSHQVFIGAQGYQFDLLVDEGLAVARAYGTATADSEFPQRTVFIVGKDGRVLFAQKGAPTPDEMIAAIATADDAPA